jgi:hypothetical protein
MPDSGKVYETPDRAAIVAGFLAANTRRRPLEEVARALSAV